MKLARPLLAAACLLAGLTLPAAARADQISGYLLPQVAQQPATVDAYVAADNTIISGVTFTLNAASPGATASESFTGTYNPFTGMAYGSIPEDGSVTPGNYSVTVTLTATDGTAIQVQTLQDGQPAIYAWTQQASLLRFTVRAQHRSATVSSTTAASASQTVSAQSAEVCNELGTFQHNCQLRPTATVRLAHGTETLTGSLRTLGGLPEPGQALVVEQTLPGQLPVPVKTIQTDALGDFQTTVTGPSRRLTVTYPGSVNFGLASVFTQVNVATPVTISANRTVAPGGRFRIGGSIRVPGVNPMGLTVQVFTRAMTAPARKRYVRMTARQRSAYNKQHPFYLLTDTKTNNVGHWSLELSAPHARNAFWFFKARAVPPASFPFALGWSAPTRIHIRARAR